MEWQQPCLPWERSQLWLGCLAAAGADGTGEDLGEGLTACRPVAGSDNGSRQAISVFQPLWLGPQAAPQAARSTNQAPSPGQVDGTGAPGALPADLLVANDRSGWWNLERLVAAEALTAAELGPSADGDIETALAEPPPSLPKHPLPWQPLLPMEAEFASPQWVLGLATTAWDGRQLVAASCVQGSWQLGRIDFNNDPGSATGQAPGNPADPPAPAQPGRWIPFDLPFNDLGSLCAENGALACLASGATSPAGLLELELASGTWRHSPAATSPLGAEAISRPEALWFAGYGGAPTHAWYYPPIGGATPASPLLVKGHSGPTAMARCGLNLAIQFWTSRGWGVVDVNYGGSTGFGRAYRERLDRHWGLVDSADCAAAALAVVAAGQASAQRIAIEGGSAGGFTVLSALCFSDVFRAGACRYAVSDLEGLVTDGHRFEAHYLDSLVGPWPEQRATYQGRSPLHHAGRISAPVIFFQGLDDQVVPPAQTDSMAEALRCRGVPVEVHRFAGEGHGFRSGAVRVAVLEATEAFFRHHFTLGCP